LLQLLQPVWLAAMAATIAPVLLHFWNDRKGKVLAIGSVSLLEKRSPRRALSRRLSEWLLLLLRCLLLIALALLLAGPSWKKGTRTGAKGWILEDGGAGLRYKPVIDSLLKLGYERHDWNPARSCWDAFRAADRTAREGTAFYIFTSGWASGFHGSRPFTDRPVHWYTYTPSDSISQWVGDAWLSSPDSIRVSEGSSLPTGSSYRFPLLAAQPGTGPVGITGGRLSVSASVPASVSASVSASVQAESQPPVIVDTAALRIYVYTDPGHTHDSRYLASAVHALQQFGRRNIQLSITGSMPDKKADWLFWLSPSPPPPGEWAGHTLQYEPGSGMPVATWMQDVDIGKETEGIGKARDPDYETIWKDGYGRSLLGLERTGHGEVYHFFSRFDPDWNGLVWSRSFPVLLERLLFDRKDRWADRDRRILDPEQIVPAKRNGETGAGRSRALHEFVPADRREEGNLDLAPTCWILAVILFILERVVSYARNPTKNYAEAGRKK
jgi:hypothetical protein